MINKKIIASALALTITVSTFTFAISLGDTKTLGVSSIMANAVAETSGDYTYTILDDGTAEITKYTGKEQDLVILSTIDGITVTSIGKNAFQKCSTLKSVTVPNGVTIIAENSFKSCQNLENVSLPNSVVSIGGYAFSSCLNLKSINIPNSVKSIGQYAFSDCKSLTNIDLPNSIESLDQEIFYCCMGLTNIEIPDSLTTIPHGLFDTCRNLKTVKIPSTITSIGDKAFYDCNNLENIEIPNSVNSIGIDAFYNCSTLESIIIPDSVLNIGIRAFRGCSNLTSVTISNSITTLGDYLFGFCEKLTNVNIPSSVTSIKDSAFRDCTSLKDVYYTGTKEEWNNIIIDSNNSCLRNATIYYNYEPHTHSYTSQVTKQPTCTATGVKTYTCECGNSYTEDIKATGHNYVDQIVAPTTTDKGYTEHTCSVCGYSYKDNYKEPTKPTASIKYQYNSKHDTFRLIVTVSEKDIEASASAVLKYKVESGSTVTENVTKIYSSFTNNGSTVSADAGTKFIISKSISNVKKGDKIVANLALDTYQTPYAITFTVQ